MNNQKLRRLETHKFERASTQSSPYNFGMSRRVTSIALLIFTTPMLVFAQSSWPTVDHVVPGFNPLIPSTAPSASFASPVSRHTDKTAKRSTAEATKAQTAKRASPSSRQQPNGPPNPHNESWRTEQAESLGIPAGDQAERNEPNDPNGGDAANEPATDAPAQRPVVLSTALPTQYRVRQLPTTAASLAAPATNLQTPQNFVAQPRLPMIDGPATGQFSFGNQIPSAAIVPQRPRRSVNIAPPPRSRALQLRSAGGGCVIRGSQSGLGNSFAPTTFIPF